MTATKRLVIVVRADPVICGHSGEARNLAEVALTRGFDDVRIVTWPIPTLQAAGLPLKPLDAVLPYSDGITVERPDPVGDYKVPDARYFSGMVGRLVELFTDGVPTVCMSLYLTPHATAVNDARAVAGATGLPMNLVTIAEAVGSDITNVVRTSVEEGLFGAAAQVFATYLANDHCVAVSEYTKELIVESAAMIDARHGTTFAAQCQRRVEISYPAIDSRQFTDLDRTRLDTVLALPLDTETVPAGLKAASIRVGGLQGGHSGLEIDRGRGNAIKLLARFLAKKASLLQVRVAHIDGGSKRNAIPRECDAVVYLPPNNLEALKKAAREFEEVCFVRILG